MIQNKRQEKQETSYTEGNKRKRIKQVRKRSIENKTLEASKYGRRGILTYWREKRRIPKAESRLDGILAAISVILGIIFTVSIFLFFTGKWSFAKYLVVSSFFGILIIAAIDSWNRKRIYSYLAIAGCILSIVFIIYMALFM